MSTDYRKTKPISGLPSLPTKAVLRKRFGKPPRKTGVVVRKLDGLILTIRNGYTHTVENPRGTLSPVAIVETSHPGYTVMEDKKPWTVLGYGYRSAPRLALRLAKKGHKVVTIRH